MERKTLQTKTDDEEKKRNEYEKKKKNITKFHVTNSPSCKALKKTNMLLIIYIII